MNIEREVIIDLLPLYSAGELSPASRRLVEEALAQDASLRQLANTLQNTTGAGDLNRESGLQQLDRELDNLLGSPPAPTAEEEKRTFSQTRLRMAVRGGLVGAAIFATLSIFAFWFDGNSITLFKEAFPQLVPPLLVAAAALWGLVLLNSWLGRN
ncbi:MAG: zf-HC2 domain-containing protein [Anaerolineales bacterium]|nr:zf-HC2 domain-containing protein [Anaerolineales bacterium]MCW5855177.1 zf-HC2 domain-containing protein [Anaerolineales bacterium]